MVVLLLLSQATLASHDLQHLDSVHSELCTVYLSQDHSAHCAATSALSITHAAPEILRVDLIDTFFTSLIPGYASRAPPKTVFLS